MADLINKETGMTYCGDMEDVLAEMLTMFVEGAPDKMKEIEDEYAGGDWENYAIHVHALKSSSLTVGGETLSALAKSIELTTKEYNKSEDEVEKAEKMEFIKAHHDELIVLYKDTIADAEEMIPTLEVEE